MKALAGALVVFVIIPLMILGALVAWLLGQQDRFTQRRATAPRKIPPGDTHVPIPVPLHTD